MLPLGLEHFQEHFFQCFFWYFVDQTINKKNKLQIIWSWKLFLLVALNISKEKPVCTVELQESAFHIFVIYNGEKASSNR